MAPPSSGRCCCFLFPKLEVCAAVLALLLPRDGDVGAVVVVVVESVGGAVVAPPPSPRPPPRSPCPSCSSLARRSCRRRRRRPAVASSSSASSTSWSRGGRRGARDHVSSMFPLPPTCRPPSPSSPLPIIKAGDDGFVDGVAPCRGRA